MKPNEAVRAIMSEKRIRVSDLAERMGKIPRLVSDRLRLENPTISKLDEMLNILGCEIVIRDKTNPTKEWVIDGGEESTTLDASSPSSPSSNHTSDTSFSTSSTSSTSSIEQLTETIETMQAQLTQLTQALNSISI